jgi:putative zinc finger/helix-turn-helix YgiT family protein
MSQPKCPICGVGELRRVTDDYKTVFSDELGRERELTVRGVTREECSYCGEVFLDEDATQKIESARLQAMRRLTPIEIKRFRERLKKTQTEMARFLGLGEKTYARWESGAYIQNVASDRYLRLLMASDVNIKILQSLAPQSELIEDLETAESSCFPAVVDHESMRGIAERFTEMLTTGSTFLPCST